MLDMFKSDPFSVINLSTFINNLKFVPGFIGSMGLFDDTPIAQTTVAIENDNDVLRLVPPTPRGGVGVTMDKARRAMLSVGVPHFEINDAVMAEEVQGLRAFGTQDATVPLMSYVGKRLQQASNSIEATFEYHMIGAVKGLITYADGSSLNLFTLFNVTQETEIDFDLDNASPASGVLRKKCASVSRLMAANLPGQPVTGVTALVGDAFFDDLIAHPEVRATYLQTAEAKDLRGAYINNGGGLQSFGEFDFGGIHWINYRGFVGATSFINTDKAHFFPVGVPGLFRAFIAPADYVETVNTLGQRKYVKQYEMQNGKGVHMDTQSNILHLCTRPKSLIQGRRT